MLQSGFDRQQLESKTVEELRKICKECGISYHENGKKIKKAQMIERLLEVTIGTDEGDNDKKIETKILSLSDEILKDVGKDECEAGNAEEEAEKLERKMKYIEQAKIGTLVAFKTSNGNVISAMIKKKSTKGRKFMVETKYGVEHKISFDDVLWVRTNKRWPKGIYLLFKQNIKAEVSKDGKEIN